MTKANNFLLLLASIGVVGLGIMAYVIYQQDAMLKDLDKQTLTLSKQSASDEIDSIEEDANETELDGLDKEVVDIVNELNASY